MASRKKYHSLSKDPRWGNDLEFCIEQLEKDHPITFRKILKEEMKGFTVPPKKYLQVKIVPNPNHEQTLENLYKRKALMEGLK